MNTIKELLDKLSDEDRRRLMYAFETGLEQYVKTDDGGFVGVNCDACPILDIKQNAGCWSAGIFKGEYRENSGIRS